MDILRRLQIAIEKSHPTENNGRIYARQLGVLEGILTMSMVEHPKLKQDIERMVKFFEERAA
jgi:hypothetical protein